VFADRDPLHWSFQLRHQPVFQPLPKDRATPRAPPEGQPSCSHKQIKQRFEHQSKQPLVSRTNSSKTVSRPRSVLQLALNTPAPGPNTLCAASLSNKPPTREALGHKGGLAIVTRNQRRCASRRMGGQTIPVGIPRRGAETRTLDQQTPRHINSNTRLPT